MIYDIIILRPAGVTSRTRIAGGVIFTPPGISGTKGRRGTREAAIESSPQDDSIQFLKFSWKGHVQGQGQVKGQKHGFRIFRYRPRTVSSSVPKISINNPKIKGKSLCTFHACSKYRSRSSWGHKRSRCVNCVWILCDTCFRGDIRRRHQ